MKNKVNYSLFFTANEFLSDVIFLAGYISIMFVLYFCYVSLKGRVGNIKFLNILKATRNLFTAIP